MQERLFGEGDTLVIDKDQTELFGGKEIANLGTFADSKSAPIHRWFQYPAGFSHKAVEYSLDHFGISTGEVVYDPFAGTGTTLLACKYRGIESLGVEAHPFVYQVAKTKLEWNYDYEHLSNFSEEFIHKLLETTKAAEGMDASLLPELVRKCYSEGNLKRLLYVQKRINETVPEQYQGLFGIAITGTLRRASAAATGWPYIAPKKKIAERDGISTFAQQLRMCVSDLRQTPSEYREVSSKVLAGDCRKTDILDSSVDFAFTSPPYLNNYDYADRTRLEMYFAGEAVSWGDISRKVRTKLIMAATTQVLRSDYDVSNILIDELKSAEPQIAGQIQESVSRLSELRNQKGGKKSYDIMVGQYFNDMTRSLLDTYRVLKQGARYLLILGDSAPYGVHIPTEEYLGKIAVGTGFKDFQIIQLRTRGDKWKSNPQRHQVALRESVLVLRK